MPLPYKHLQLYVICLLICLPVFSLWADSDSMNTHEIVSSLNSLNASRDANEIPFPDLAIKYDDLMVSVSTLEGEESLKAEIYYHKGVLFDNIGDADSATVLYELAKGILESERVENVILSKIYNNLATIYLYQDPLSARQLILKSRKLYRKDQGVHRYFITENTYATVLQLLGDLDEAEVILHQLEDTLDVVEKVRPGVADTFRAPLVMNLANVKDLLSKHHEAEVYYQKALDAGYYPEDVYQNWATILNQVKDSGAIKKINLYEEALLSAEPVLRALDLWDEYKGDAFNIRATYYYNFGDYEKARSLHKQSFSYYEKADKQLYYYDNIGDVYFALGELELALEHYHKALQFIDPTLDDNPYSIPNLSRAIQIDFLQNATIILQSKAKTLTKLFEESRDVNFLTTAVEHYKELDRYYDFMLSYMVSESSQLHLLKHAKLAYEFSIYACYLGSLTSDQEKWVDLALYFFERSKAVLLQKNILSTTMLESLSEHMADSITDLKYTAFFDVSFDSRKNAREALKEIDLDLQRKFPGHFNAYRLDNELLSVGNIQASILESNQALLQFFEGDTILYRISIQHDGHQFARIQLDSNYSNNISKLYSLISDKFCPVHFNDLINAIGFDLYQTLFQDLSLAESTNRLLIIPDGRISLIPLSVLSYTDNSNFSFIEKLVLSKYATGFAYSLTTYRYQSPLLKTAAAAFVPDYSNSAFGSLPGAKSEAKTFAQYLSGKIYRSAKANKKAFLKNADNYGIILFSGHAEADTNDYFNTFLVTDPESHNPRLTLAEIFSNGGLTGQFIHLSACESGLGPNSPGEGVLSADRIFKSLGMESVLMSRWKMSDRAGMKINQEIYRLLAEGHHKDEALRMAKLNYLENCRDDRERHPFMWAGNVLIGSQAPLILDENPPWYFFLLLIPVLIIIAILKKR